MKNLYLHQLAFDNLKKALLSDMILSYPDMNLPFSIACDASSTGIGAVLFQNVDGETKFVTDTSFEIIEKGMVFVVPAKSKFLKERKERLANK